MLVNQTQLANALGISTRHVRELQAEKNLFKAKSGTKYELDKCVADYVAYKIEAETSTGNSVDYWEEKALHEESKRKITELNLSRMRRESFDASDVEDAWGSLILAFKEELQSLPHKLSPQLIGVDDMGEMARIIETEINSALITLAHFSLDKIESGGYMLEEMEDEEEYPDEPAQSAATASTGKKTNSQRVGRGKQKNSRR